MSGAKKSFHGERRRSDFVTTFNPVACHGKVKIQFVGEVLKSEKMSEQNLNEVISGAREPGCPARPGGLAPVVERSPRSTAQRGGSR
jgi:hypothetical protein